MQSDRPQDRGKGGIRQGISNYFVNTIVTALQGSDWERLLKRRDIMLHLLAETAVFVPLHNDCLCQVAGAPVIYSKPPPWDNMGQALKSGDMCAKRKAVDAVDSARTAKRSRALGGCTETTKGPAPSYVTLPLFCREYL
ncbi:hypothetical protein OF83DRAFT_1055383 [Amylostereum chailletii]|nr:hypothetical protein OF83DRAFT_1055383 [Amylostereum chailletii]